MFQRNFLAGLSRAGLRASLILSQRPEQAFPRGRSLFVGSRSERLEDIVDIELMPFINLHGIRQMHIGLGVVCRLAKWGWRNRFSKKVVFVYNLTEPSGLFVLLAARLIRAKAIVALADINVPGQTVPNSPLRRFDFWLQKKILPCFDGIMTISEQAIDDLAPNVRFIRLEGGINWEALRSLRQQTRVERTEKSPFTIVSAGALKEANGIRELLDAFALLPGNDYRLVIAGSGPLADLVEERSGVDRRIEYVGFLSFDEVLKLYSQADVLVNMRITKRLNTAYFFPSKMMEYLGSGVPVISTCVEKEWSDITFPLIDEIPQSLAELIQHVASLPLHERSAKGAAAQAYVADHYTWEAQSSKVKRFVEHILG